MFRLFFFVTFLIVYSQKGEAVHVHDSHEEPHAEKQIINPKSVEAFSGREIIGVKRLPTKKIEDTQQDLYEIVKKLESRLKEYLKPTTSSVSPSDQKYVDELTKPSSPSGRSEWNETQHRLCSSKLCDGATACSPVYHRLKPRRFITEPSEYPLKILYFKNCGLTTDRFSFMLDLLERFQHLEYIDFEGNLLDDKAIPFLVRLARLPSIKYINLRHNSFTDKAFEEAKAHVFEKGSQKHQLLKKLVFYTANEIESPRGLQIKPYIKEEIEQFDQTVYITTVK